MKRETWSRSEESDLTGLILFSKIFTFQWYKKKRKTGNPHNGDAEITEYSVFLPENLLKLSINNQNSQVTNRLIVLHRPLLSVNSNGPFNQADWSVISTAQG